MTVCKSSVVWSFPFKQTGIQELNCACMQHGRTAAGLVHKTLLKVICSFGLP